MSNCFYVKYMKAVAVFVWQKNKPPARQVEGVALASSKKPPVII